MSERSDLDGASAPAHKLVHGDKTYFIPHALTVGDLMQIEQTLFDSACEALYRQKRFMDADKYDAELAKLRREYQDGAYSFQNAEIQAMLKKPAGAVLFMRSIMKVEEAEFYE